MIDSSIIKLLQEHRDNIEQDDYNPIYVAATEAALGEDQIHQITELLQAAGIDPLSNQDRIPEHYLSYSDVEHINIPNHIRWIGHNAFMGCNNLEEVTIPGTVLTIGIRAFSHCSNLWKVKVEEGVEDIDAATFAWDGVLENVTLPGTLKQINARVFWKCGLLEQITFTGTKQQWNNIIFDLDNHDLFECKIRCVDGEIAPGWAETWDR